MRVKCPACNAETSLELLLGREVDARAFAGFLERHLPLGDAMVRYIALFRPPKRQLSMSRAIALIEELLPDIERQQIDRKGRPWHADARAWRHAFETVLAARDKGSLVLPLTSHGYLYEVLVGLAEKAESAHERQREADRQRPQGMRGTGPRDLADVADQVVGAATHVAPPQPMPPAAPPPGPSRAALEIQARIASSRNRGLAQAEGGDA